MARLFLSLLILPVLLNAQTAGTQDPSWNRMKFFEGRWSGAGSGEPGNSTVQREYRFVLNGAYLFGKNTSTFLPQEKNPKGEIHEDWGMFSRDRSRRLVVLRQFNIESFVNQYTLDTLRTDSTTIVFTTEAIENIPAGWRARETYTIVNRDEFIETFELAGPGKEFSVYTRTALKRTAP